jgi:predicted MFS family arabinose efflux permease
MTSRPAGRATSPADRGSRVGFRITAGMLTALMLGGTLPVPLYVLYEAKMGFGSLGVTVVFATYVIGTLTALLGFGDLSDHIGRKKVLAGAIACAAISTAFFLIATSIGELIVARVISGLAAGFATGTATAALAELSGLGGQRRAAVVASAANLTGLGLGPLVAGLFAQYLGAPTRTVFWAYLGVCALLFLALFEIPETVRHPDRVFRVHLRVGVPADMRLILLGAGLGVFAAFSILGLFSSLVPTFVRGVLGISNLAIIGTTGFVIFITAAISQAASARLASRRSVSVGLPGLFVGLACLETSLFTDTEWLFYAATVASGIAVGLIFRGGLSEINKRADPAHRAEVVSTFFAIAYVGLGLPVVLIGAIAQAVGPVDASAWVAGLNAAVILIAAVVVFRTFGKAAQPAPSAVCPDSWCDPQTVGSSSRP